MCLFLKSHNKYNHMVWAYINSYILQINAFICMYMMNMICDVYTIAKYCLIFQGLFFASEKHIFSKWNDKKVIL